LSLSDIRLILLLRNSRIVRRRKDRGGLWLSSRGLGCAPVYSGGGDAGWFDGLFCFVCVRAGSLCVTVPPFLCLWILASGYWWVEILDRLRCLLWWLVSWGVSFLTCVGSLVGRSLLIRGREQVCDSGPFRLLWCLLRLTGTWVVVEAERLKQYHNQVPNWSLLAAVLVLWGAVVRGVCFFRVLVVVLWGVLVLLFFSWTTNYSNLCAN